MNERERSARRPARSCGVADRSGGRSGFWFSSASMPGLYNVQWAFSCRTVDAPHRRCTHSRAYTRPRYARALDRTDSSVHVCVRHTRYARTYTYARRSLGKPGATKAVRHRVSQTLIWITKTARGILLSDSDLLYVLSLSLSHSLFLLCLRLSTCIARSALSSFNGNDLSIHLFRTVYVPLVAFRPNAAVARVNHTRERLPPPLIFIVDACHCSRANDALIC